jgi:phenylalanyl-tRNA synthetase beta chain
MTSPEREGRLLASVPNSESGKYVRISNPIAPERSVLRRSLLASVLEVAEQNARHPSIAMFEVGPVFEPNGSELPREPRKMALVMSGARIAPAWDVKDAPALDFFDMKGRIELLLAGLRCTDVVYAETRADHLHPGKSAEVKVDGLVIGVFGELHPLAKENYDFQDAPVIVAEFDLDSMRALSPMYGITAVAETPPIFEDIAIIVDENLAASQIEALIRQTGGKIVTDVRLFDLYRDEKIGAGKKSLAYSLTYQSDKTMTDAEAAAIRTRIVKRLEQEFGAKLRS